MAITDRTYRIGDRVVVLSTAIAENPSDLTYSGGYPSWNPHVHRRLILVEGVVSNINEDEDETVLTIQHGLYNPSENQNFVNRMGWTTHVTLNSESASRRLGMILSKGLPEEQQRFFEDLMFPKVIAGVDYLRLVTDLAHAAGNADYVPTFADSAEIATKAQEYGVVLVPVPASYYEGTGWSEHNAVRANRILARSPAQDEAERDSEPLEFDHSDADEPEEEY